MNIKLNVEQYKGTCRAMLTSESHIELRDTIKGCPLGRDSSVIGAVQDWIRRTNMEPGLAITEADVTFTFTNHDAE